MGPKASPVPTGDDRIDWGFFWGVVGFYRKLEGIHDNLGHPFTFNFYSTLLGQTILLKTTLGLFWDRVFNQTA